MTNLGFVEQAQVYKVGFIATRMCAILGRIQSGRGFHKKDFATLAEGADLISRIISGSLLVEDKQGEGGLAPSLEGLAVLGSALSVLRLLGSEIEEGGLTDLFMHYHSSLADLSKGGKAKEEDLATLKEFFEVLSRLIMNDIKSENLNLPGNEIIMRSVCGFSSAYAI